MYTDDYRAYRQTFADAWQKYQKQLPLSPLEQQLIHVILAHPEYHALLSADNETQQQTFLLEENPYFHMSLHLSVQEQIKLDKPKGVKNIYQQLLQHHTPHDTEHFFVTVLAQILWQAQRNNIMPDDANYLAKLRELLVK